LFSLDAGSREKSKVKNPISRPGQFRGTTGGECPKKSLALSPVSPAVNQVSGYPSIECNEEREDRR
jgi:hypothetical protein